MSTALASTRTGASRASSALLNSSPSKVSPSSTTYSPSQLLWKQGQHAPSRKNLINQMHKRLYPHLYDGNGKPNQMIFASKTATKKNSKSGTELRRRFKLAQPAPAIKKTCPDPVSTVTSSQIALLDPTGARTRLFAKDNPECARVGDILLVRQRTGDPFAGVCINIRRRGVDTAILLRGQLTRVGIEMWYKIYSPLVEGIEVVQRAAKRARRARLTYMRKEKHDRGSVENVVRVYLRQKAALGTADGQKKKGAAAAAAAAGGRKGNKRGKKR